MHSSSAIKVSELSANVPYQPFALITSDHFLTSKSTSGWLKRNSEPPSSRPNTTQAACETARNSAGAQHVWRCRGWLTDRGSNGCRGNAHFLDQHDVMLEVELKHPPQASYPGLTFWVAVTVQYDPQRTIQGPTGHVVQLLRSTGCNSFKPLHALFENPGSNDGFNIWSMCLSMTGLA